MADKSEPICFVISPIGAEGSEIRKWANQTFKHLIEPVVNERGFSAKRADKEDRAGIITTHIIQRLVNSELVIADLTSRNPNVFYELAVRHVTRKPLVQIIREDEEIPFDVQGMRTVKFNLADPDILEAAREELARHVDAVKDEDRLDTPISQAVELQIAMDSGDPNQVGLAEIASSLQDLTAEVRAQAKTAGSPPLPWPSVRTLSDLPAAEKTLSRYFLTTSGLREGPEDPPAEAVAKKRTAKAKKQRKSK